ncbi:MAG: hypothetical protein HYT16_03015 [DPANN group archaeon]|nr:hypothetical protein [DPANN group archaeon]
MHQIEVKLQKRKVHKKYTVSFVVLPKQILKYAPQIKKARKVWLAVDLLGHITIKP